MRGGGGGALSTADSAPPCLVWLPVGQLLHTGSNTASISLHQSWAGNPLHQVHRHAALRLRPLLDRRGCSGAGGRGGRHLVNPRISLGVHYNSM